MPKNFLAVSSLALAGSTPDNFFRKDNQILISMYSAVILYKYAKVHELKYALWVLIAKVLRRERNKAFFTLVSLFWVPKSNVLKISIMMSKLTR